MRKIIKIKSKKLAKANYGMAVTDDKNKTVVGTGTQARWTNESAQKAKNKYPQFVKDIDKALSNQNTKDKALADQEIARANVAKKEATAATTTTPIVIRKNGGSMYKKGGPVKKKITR